MNGLAIRSFPIEHLITKCSFVETLILTLTGELPLPLDPRVHMLNAILVAWVDHGEPPPSTQNVRNAASVGVPFLQAASAGFACFGADHGPIEQVASLFARMKADTRPTTIPSEMLARKETIPGFGHPVHNDDPRTAPLWRIAEELAFVGDHCQMLADVEYLFQVRSKNVKANLAGVSAALWLDMGFTVETAGIIAIVGRSVGLAAHYAEQRRNPKKFKGTP